MALFRMAPWRLPVVPQSDPPLTLVPPVKVLLPANVRRPSPFFTSPPLPPMSPENSVLALLPPIVRSAPPLNVTRPEPASDPML